MVDHVLTDNRFNASARRGDLAMFAMIAFTVRLGICDLNCRQGATIPATRAKNRLSRRKNVTG